MVQAAVLHSLIRAPFAGRGGGVWVEASRLLSLLPGTFNCRDSAIAVMSGAAAGKAAMRALRRGGPEP